MYKKILRGENKQVRNVVKKQRAKALIPGTVKYKNLKAINESIRAYKNNMNASGCKRIKDRKV